MKNRVKQTTLDRYQCVTRLLIEELGLREMSRMAGEDLNLFLEMSTKLITLPPESAANKIRLFKPHVSGSRV